MAAVPPVTVPVTVQFTGDEVELLTGAVELLADIQQHLPHRAEFETAERIGEVAATIARVLEVVEP